MISHLHEFFYKDSHGRRAYVEISQNELVEKINELIDEIEGLNQRVIRCERERRSRLDDVDMALDEFDERIKALEKAQPK
jgi:hypothetical protein